MVRFPPPVFGKQTVDRDRVEIACSRRTAFVPRFAREIAEPPSHPACQGKLETLFRPLEE